MSTYRVCLISSNQLQLLSPLPVEGIASELGDLLRMVAMLCGDGTPDDDGSGALSLSLTGVKTTTDEELLGVTEIAIAPKDARLQGSLSPSLQKINELERLALAGHQLSGSLEALRECRRLTELDLSGNRLKGELEALRGCTGLRTLNMAENTLVGGLEALSECAELEELEKEDTEDEAPTSTRSSAWAFADKNAVLACSESAASRTTSAAVAGS